MSNEAAAPRDAGFPLPADALQKVIDEINPSVFVGVLTTDGILTHANRAAIGAIDARPDEVLGKQFDATPWWAFSDVSRQRLRIAIESAAAGMGSRFDVLVEDKAGRLLTLDFSLQPVFGNDGRVACLVPSARDVTESRKAERELRLTQFAVDNAHEAIFRVGCDGRIRCVNDAACRHLGYAREALVGRYIHEIDALETAADWPAVWAMLRKQRSLRFESNHRRADGSIVPVEVFVSYMNYEGDEYSFAHVVDISERIASERRLHHLARHDLLTQLPNRMMLRNRLAHLLHGSRGVDARAAVVLMGLDRFKLVNDTLGHPGGDAILQEVARRLDVESLKAELVARVGGDEFGIVLTGDAAAPSAVAHTARTVHSLLARPFAAFGQDVVVTCSVGTAASPADGAEVDELLRNAWAALHRAKAHGRDCIEAYSAEAAPRDLTRLRLEADLRKALEQQRLDVHYQAQVDVDTNDIVGAEALLRWNHPRDGIVGPDRFIPLAEESGLILPIGEWTFRRACEQIVKWRETGASVRHVGVNVSPRQFRDLSFVPAIVRILSETGASAEQIELELTESMLVQDFDASLEAMAVLKDIGVRLALDDFGTGYSSLEYIKRLPIDTIKIDRAFMRDLAHDASSEAIIECILALGRRLGLTVVAEGVESTEQLAMLRKLGGMRIQGYAVHKPAGSDRFPNTADQLRGLGST